MGLGERLTEEQRVQLEELIDRYEHIFTDVPGDSNLTEHQIEVTSEEHIRSKPYAIPYKVRESLNEDIQAMLQMGVIRESKSPYASPVVVVRIECALTIGSLIVSRFSTLHQVILPRKYFRRWPRKNISPELI